MIQDLSPLNYDAPLPLMKISLFDHLNLLVLSDFLTQ